MISTGRREGMIADYKVGFNDDGTVTALDLHLVIDGMERPVCLSVLYRYCTGTVLAFETEKNLKSFENHQEITRKIHFVASCRISDREISKLFCW